ncbi:MAG: hypothetical protein ACJAQZ_005012, partial [Planctomycetota bacterium]
HGWFESLGHDGAFVHYELITEWQICMSLPQKLRSLRVSMAPNKRLQRMVHAPAAEPQRRWADRITRSLILLTAASCVSRPSDYYTIEADVR